MGSAAVQLGKAAGARVIDVVGGPEKAAVARGLGANVAVDRHEQDFVAVVNDDTDGRGADVIYDPAGGETFQRSTKCIAFEGRLLVVGFAGGQIQSTALNHALVKNYSILGLHWGLYNSHDLNAVRACRTTLSKLADESQIRPLVGERVGLDAVAASLQRLRDGLTIGRVVFCPGP